MHPFILKHPFTGAGAFKKESSQEYARALPCKYVPVSLRACVVCLLRDSSFNINSSSLSSGATACFCSTQKSASQPATESERGSLKLRPAAAALLLLNLSLRLDSVSKPAFVRSDWRLHLGLTEREGVRERERERCPGVCVSVWCCKEEWVLTGEALR